MTNPFLRAFEDIGQSDWHGELCAAELGPICIGVDALTNRSVWYRDRAPAPDYATYSDGTPPDPAHENAGDRAARKTAELLKRQAIHDDCGELSRAEMRAGRIEWTPAARLAQRLIDETNIAPQSGYYGFRDPPAPASASSWPDRACRWSCYGVAVCVLGCLWFLFT